jgi:hypothetical protein
MDSFRSAQQYPLLQGGHLPRINHLFIVASGIYWDALQCVETNAFHVDFEVLIFFG